MGCTSDQQKIVGQWEGTTVGTGMDKAMRVITTFDDNGYCAVYVGFKGLELLGQTEPGKWEYNGKLTITGMNGTTSAYNVDFEADDKMILTDTESNMKIICRRITTANNVADSKVSPGVEEPTGNDITPTDNLEDVALHYLQPKSGGRMVSFKWHNSDVDGDGHYDAVAEYCVQPTEDDLDAGGGNAMSNMACWESGILVVRKSRNQLEVLSDQAKSEFFIPMDLDFTVDGVEGNTLTCTVTYFKEDDYRGFPSGKRPMHLVFSQGKFNRS